MHRHTTPHTALFALALALLSTLVSVSAQAQTTYTFTDLGVLAAGVSSQGAFATGINHAGQISVASRDASGALRTLRITPTIVGGQPVWFSGSNGVNTLMQALPLPSPFTRGFIGSNFINATGQVAATEYTGSTPEDAFVCSPSLTPTVLTSTKVTSTVKGLNDLGDVVGTYWDYKHNISYDVLWQCNNGVYTTLQFASAQALNNTRQVVGNGSGTGTAFLWLPSSDYGLPAGTNPLGGISVGWQSVNDSGIVVGKGVAPNNPNHILVWVPQGGAFGLSAGLTDIDDGVWASCSVQCLNNPTTGNPLLVVGSARDSSGNSVAVAWDSTSRKIQNLNLLTTNLPSGWVLQSANGVNDLGQIVGNGSYNGTAHAFVLTPNP